MQKRKWTDEQLSAIETRDRTLLVSAAAGSGKTATLTERIIRSLTDEKKTVDITSMLIVTFTNAAANELRAKISRALEMAVKANPNDKNLARQLYLLPSAKIRTIDGFCNDILRANCDRVGIVPSYRIADEAETELLASSILEGLIEGVYSGELPEIASAAEFEALADCLSDSKRSEEVTEVFRYIHARCESSELGVDLLLPLIEKYNPKSFESVEKSPFGEYLLGITREALLHYIEVYRRYERELCGGTVGEQKYLDMLNCDLDLITKLYNLTGYSALREQITSYTFTKKPLVKKTERTGAMDEISLVRDMLKDTLKEFRPYYLYTEDEWGTLYASLYASLSVFYRFIKHFDLIFSEEKRRRGALSYADIEKYAYKCLVENSKPTDIAENLKSSFAAIYIDEYQDVNSLQNSIFASISRPDNRFMVGDIKQSIYGFRSARPEIFANMKNSFPPLSESRGNEASIFMSKNFRCDEGIVDFVNKIFDTVFSGLGESIGYCEGDRLGYAKLQDSEPPYRAPQICMIDKGGDEDDEQSDAPAIVAEKIADLLKNGKLNSGEPIKPSDIAIIMRNALGKDRLYAEALEAAGIPSEISGGESFFLSAEVLLALCLLNTIDNPRRDVYLAGLLVSPLYEFTADDLYKIRKEFPCDSLYSSLASYVEAHPEFERGERFLSALAHYRAISEGVRVDTLLFRLYHETGLFALAAKSGGEENLNLLYDYARSYEAGAFRGLYNFISFINNIIDKRTTFDDNRELGDKNAVKIITCHASKGLEYPVVFLVNTGARITNRDKSNRLVFSESFGISHRLRTVGGYALVNNPVQDLVNHYVYTKLYEEELRVLYVALTRAREQLFVIGSCPTVKREEYDLSLEVKRKTLSPYLLKQLSSTLEIMLVAGNNRPISVSDFIGKDLQKEELSPEKTTEAREDVTEKRAMSEEEKSELLEEYIRRFTYEYPNMHLCTLPEKLSVSRTSPTLLDEGDDGVLLFTEQEEEKADEKGEIKHTLPRFAEGNAAEESAKRGIATHYLLQFCDLERLQRDGARAELSRLLAEGFISKKDAERVRIREIETFRKSSLFEDMMRAKCLYREFRFNSTFPASLFTTDEEKRELYKGKTVLVQGVIDCLIEYEDGSFGLFDYKTDRLTPEELSDERLAEEKLRKKHSLQLSYYALAVEKIFGKLPSRVEVYSLPLGRTVDVKTY